MSLHFLQNGYFEAWQSARRARGTALGDRGEWV